MWTIPNILQLKVLYSGDLQRERLINECGMNAWILLLGDFEQDIHISLRERLRPLNRSVKSMLSTSPIYKGGDSGQRDVIISLRMFRDHPSFPHASILQAQRPPVHLELCTQIPQKVLLGQDVEPRALGSAWTHSGSLLRVNLKQNCPFPKDVMLGPAIAEKEQCSD